jgi:hypothetical protein
LTLLLLWQKKKRIRSGLTDRIRQFTRKIPLYQLCCGAMHTRQIRSTANQNAFMREVFLLKIIKIMMNRYVFNLYGVDGPRNSKVPGAFLILEAERSSIYIPAN